MEGWRFDWRYVVAGLGWGLLVGAATGALVVLVVLADNMTDTGIASPRGLLGLLLVLLMAAIYGIIPGAVTGTFAGLVTGLTLGGIRDRRRAWWSAFAVSLVPGIAGTRVTTLLLGWDLGDPTLWPLFLAPVAGAWLMARTTGPVLAAADRREAEFRTRRG